MSKKIQSVDDLLATIHEAPAGPGRREMEFKDSMFGMNAPAWGSPSSLDAGDVASRIGIDMGEPTVKAAALRHALLHDEAAVLEKIALMPLVAAGGRRLAQWGGKALGAAKNFGPNSRRFFQNRRVAERAKRVQAAQTRKATHASKTQGLTGASKRHADLSFQGKETGRALAGGAMALGGTAMTAHDVRAQSRDWRVGGPGASGYGVR